MSATVELIDRLTAATGPSLELDGQIWCAVNGYEFVMWDGAGCVYRDPNAPKWDAGIKHAQASIVRPYSASVDAAIALAKRVLPGAPVIMGWDQTETTRPWARVGTWSAPDATGATPAISLILATLKALASNRSAE